MGKMSDSHQKVQWGIRVVIIDWTKKSSSVSRYFLRPLFTVPIAGFVLLNFWLQLSILILSKNVGSGGWLPWKEQSLLNTSLQLHL